MYCASYGLVLWDGMLFITASDLCVFGVTSHIPLCLFLVPFNISCPFLQTDISCLSSVMVNPSSPENPNDISWAVIIFGKM